MSRKRAERRRMCGKKQRHRESSDAERHAAQLWYKDGERMNVYRCRWCGYYHVGHRSRYVKKRGLIRGESWYTVI